MNFYNDVNRIVKPVLLAISQIICFLAVDDRMSTITESSQQEQQRANSANQTPVSGELS